MSAQPTMERIEVEIPTEERDTYLVRAREYERVTNVISNLTPQRLLSWYAKQSALQAAAPLVMAGMHVPELMDDLESFVQSKALRQLTPAQAVSEACDWADNMREPLRYRDHRARVGSVVHNARYDHALGLRVKEADLADYLTSLAMKVVRRGCYAPWLKRETTEYGKTPEQLARDIAFQAAPNWQRLLQHIELFMPDPLAIGQEAVVVDDVQEVAGTVDDFSVYRRCHWEKHLPWPEGFPDSEALLVCDDKNSRYLADTVCLQMGKYSRCQFIVLTKDGSVHDVPDVDGALCRHVRRDKPVRLVFWDTREKLDYFNDAFDSLNHVVRAMAGKPKPCKTRKPAAPRPPRRHEKQEVDW